MTKIVKNLDFLRQKSAPVESAQEAQAIIEKLQDLLEKTDNGVGLGAIQIGIPKQVAVIKSFKEDPDNPGKCIYRYIINPELIEHEDEFVFGNEGCLSMPGVFNNTFRYKQILIKNNIIDGDKLREEKQVYYYSSDPKEVGNDRLTCIAVQHEMDHFEGKLITDYNIPSQSIKRDNAKVGRNDKCPCGSGKKFKKCCLGTGKFD